MAIDKLKKLRTFQENPQLALMDELEDIGKSLETLAKNKVIFSVDDIEFEKEQMKFKSGMLTLKGDKGDQGEAGKDAPPADEEKITQSVLKQLPLTDIAERVLARVPVPKDGKDGADADERVIEEKVLARIPKPKDGKDGSSDTPEQTRNKLSSLQGNERLDASAIKGLDEMKKELDTKISKSLGAAPRASNSMKIADLSSQTDGSKKIFTVPKGLLGFVIGSDFPTVLMENNGYTINSTRTQITLTFITAPSAGSQLLFAYMSIFN